MQEEFIENAPTFEDYGHQNGAKYWLASEYSKMLGYPSIQAFTKPIQRAMQACLTLGIDPQDDFKRIEPNGGGYDYKLSRFACFLIAMNGDVRKPNVAKAQIYFTELARRESLILEDSEDVERLVVRDEIKSGNTELAKAAKSVGVINYGLFQDAGYRGLYNRGLKKLLEYKGLGENAQLLDYISRTELSANLFRVTMTEERLRSDKSIKTEKQAQEAHHSIGAKVRGMVKENTGLFPEELPIKSKITEVAKRLKKGQKTLNSPDIAKKKPS